MESALWEWGPPWWEGDWGTHVKVCECGGSLSSPVALTVKSSDAPRPAACSLKAASAGGLGSEVPKQHCGNFVPLLTAHTWGEG